LKCFINDKSEDISLNIYGSDRVGVDSGTIWKCGYMQDIWS